jgi:sulfatase maturation enzyme AslB (radical SAM superfamily)
MDEVTLDAYIPQLMESWSGPQVDVAWQGGEPMLRGLDFYRRSVQLANQYRKPHQHVLHTMQTNGTLVDDERAAFFKANNYLAGLSVDGPRESHDAYRVNKQGEGSFDDVIRGWNCLRKHDVDVNTRIDKPMKTMANLLRQGRYADEIMRMSKSWTIGRSSASTRIWRAGHSSSRAARSSCSAAWAD